MRLISDSKSSKQWWVSSRQRKERLKRDADERRERREREETERSLLYAEEALFDAEVIFAFLSATSIRFDLILAQSGDVLSLRACVRV